MIRTLTTLAAEGSPAGDFIRQNETLAGFVCIGAVIFGIWLLTRIGKK